MRRLAGVRRPGARVAGALASGGVRERYVATNGVRLLALEAGEGPLVLFLHGFPQLGWCWRHQLGPVAEAGFRAVAVDLPGYGRSDKPEVGYDVRWLADTLVGVVPALGHERAVVVGHDWGGLLVWPMARWHRRRVAGVVGVNTPDLPRGSRPPTESLRELSGGRPNYMLQFQDRGAAEFFVELDVDGFADMMFRSRVTVNTEAFPDDVVRVYADALRPLGAVTPPLEYYRNLDRNWELTAELADVPVGQPALMVSADRDPVLAPVLSEGMEERVPDLTRATIHDCGHFTPEERPAELNAALLEWLRRLDPWE